MATEAEKAFMSRLSKVLVKDMEKERISPTIPDRLVNSFGGIVGEYADYINSISAALNRHTAFLGALAFCSFCASRRYRTESNLTPELYIVALCPSGGGKDLPRKVNNELAFQIGARDNVVMDIASGEGGEDAIMEHAKILAQIDEFDTLLRSIAEDRGGTKESLVRFILQAYTSGGSFMRRRQKARGKDAQDSRSFCHRPGLTVFGTGIKSMFFAALNDRAMCNGMFARMLVCPCEPRETIRDVVWSDIPNGIIDGFKAIAGSYTVQNGSSSFLRLPDVPSVKPQPEIVRLADDKARDELARIGAEADTWYMSFPDDESGEPGRAIANRTREHALRLAMVRAISREAFRPSITDGDIKWGYDFARWSQRAMLRAAGEYCFRNPFDEQMLRVKRMFNGKKEVTRREISRGLRLKVAEVDEVVKTMIDNGTLAYSEDGSGRLLLAERQ